MQGGIRKALLIAMLVAIAGGNWCALQSLAWMTMLAGNLRMDSFTAAVERTFDGKHPCPLCKAIAAGKKSEEKKEYAAPFTRLEFPPLPGRFVMDAPERFPRLPLIDRFSRTLRTQPPTPPPRFLFA